MEKEKGALLIKETQHDIHYSGNCEDCEWDVDIGDDTCKNKTDVRKATRQHVIRTGHTAYIRDCEEVFYEKKSSLDGLK